MNWIVDFDREMGLAKLVDLDGTDPPRTLAGDMRTIALAVRSIVPFKERIMVDVTGYGLSFEQSLSAIGVQTTKLRLT